MGFTLSLDDFIITHFTRGAGINTLSTLIYSEVRRGIKPSMYALSTIIFVTVLALLLITNFAPKESGAKPQKNMQQSADKGRKISGPHLKKGLLAAASFAIVAVVCFTTYIRYTSKPANELYVYNWVSILIRLSSRNLRRRQASGLPMTSLRPTKKCIPLWRLEA